MVVSGRNADVSGNLEVFLDSPSKELNDVPGVFLSPSLSSVGLSSASFSAGQEVS